MLGLGLGLPLTPLMGAITELTRSLKLSLNFLSGTLDPRITFTRASSATYFDSTGRMVTAGNNVARFDYDPVTLLSRGLLIEEQRTNLLLQSRDMTQAAWTKMDVTAARTQVGIDGVANSACLLTEGVTGTSATEQPGTASAGSTITASVVFKRGNTDWVRIIVSGSGLTDGANAWFNLGTGLKGSVTARGVGANNSSTMTSLGGGWYRCTVTSTPNGSYTDPRIFVCSANANASTTRSINSTYIVDAAQLEVGAFATSYIPTTTATATRAADSASMTGTNFSSWWNASAGTFVVEGDTLVVSPSLSAFLSADNGTASERIQLRGSPSASGYNLNVVTGGAVVAGLNSGTYVQGGVVKFSGAYAPNDFAEVVSGQPAQTDTSGAVPTPTQMTLGSGINSVALNGHIRSIRYYNTRLPNAQLQALTA